MPKKEKNKKPHKNIRRFVRLQILLIIAVLIWLGYYFFHDDVSQVKELYTEAQKIAQSSTPEDFKTDQTSILYADDGTQITTLKGEKDSYYLDIAQIPYNVRSAIVSIEDKRFYSHEGYDKKAIVRAFLSMLRNGEVTQGGSTITQQLARNIYLNRDKTWQRKAEEIFLAAALEEKYAKNEILEFYLNNIYFGNGYYGIQAASLGYFSKDVNELTLSETAFLLAIPNSPTYYDPIDQKDHTLSRRDLILDNMKEDGLIGEQMWQEAKNETITLHRTARSKHDYIETYAYYCATRALMEQQGFLFKNSFSSDEEKAEYEQSYRQMYDSCQQDLYRGGYRIYTSIDLETQDDLQDAINTGLASFTEKDEEGIFQLQGDGVCIDNDTGFVKAIVGGRSNDLAGYTLNRAYQSYRQPGSAIKPLIVYLPAIERGYTADTIVNDEPIEDGPSNAGGGYAGEITLRQAVAASKNTIAWKLFEELTPDAGLSYLLNMDFKKIDTNDYRLASSLGGFTYGASAVEMTSAFATIENDGVYRTPTCIKKMTDEEGTVLYEADQTGKSIYKKNAARQMTDMLKTVMTDGTARGLDLGEMPSAGKTGTTNDNKDGWFVGYTAYYTTGIWVGYDMPQSMDDLMGNTYPGRIWQSFMETIHEGLTPKDFPEATSYETQQKESDVEQTDEQAQDQLGNETIEMAGDQMSIQEIPQANEQTMMPEAVQN